MTDATTISSFHPALVRNRNPHLNINPSASVIGCENAILTGTSRRYFVPRFAGSLSLKFVLRGVSTWNVDGREFRVRESSLLAVNDAQPYSMFYDELRPVTTFCVFFRRGFVEDVARTLRCREESLLSYPAERLRLEFPVHLLTRDSIIIYKLRAFARELGTNNLTRETWDEHFLSLAMVMVRQHCPDTPALAERLSAVTPAVRKELLSRAMLARDFILSNSDRTVTLVEISRAARLSPFHLHRTFARAFGQTPQRFLKAHRLSRAAHLLRITNDSVAMICHDVGFESVTSFIAAFRNNFGTTPNAFRIAR